MTINYANLERNIIIMSDKHTKDMSKNHRSRLRKRYELGGADSFDDYLMMELLLFDFIPRVDTYPAAHRLIDTFGSIEKVFGSPKEELVKIEGIGPKTAEKIEMYGDLIERAVSERLSCVPFTSDNGAAPYLIWMFRKLEIDTVCLILLNERGYITERNIFLPYESKEGSILIASDEIIGGRKPAYAILAHKHPVGSLEVSGNDILVTEGFFNICEKYGTIPLQHYIVTDREISAIIEPLKSKAAKQQKLSRKYMKEKYKSTQK